MRTRQHNEDSSTSAQNNPFQPRPFADESEQAVELTSELSPSNLHNRLEYASRSGHHFSNIPIFSPQPKSAVQAKLTVGEPNDQYEQEADWVAEQVMSMAPPVTPNVQRQIEGDEEIEIQTKPLAETITPLVQRQELSEDEDEEPIQAKCEACEQEEQLQRLSNEASQVQPDLESRLNASKGGGSPLPNEVRSFMEPRFGADFSHVRIHSDGNAIQMNRELNAQAFAHESDIYFGAGKTPAKDDLTAHELTHVVQQKGIKPLQSKIALRSHKSSVRMAQNAALPWAKESQSEAKNEIVRSQQLWERRESNLNVAQRRLVSQPMGWGLIQRQDAAKAGEDATKLKKAEEDFTKFASKQYKYDNFSIQGGKFDVVYQPAAKTMNVNMKIQFKFLNDTSSVSNLLMHALQSLFSDADADAYAAANGMWTTKDQTDYRKLFRSQVMGAWNDHYLFTNVREPQAVWKKLGPVHVNLNLIEVNANPHFLIQVHKKAGRAQVWKGVTDLHPGDEKTQSPFLHADATKGELDRLAKINPSPILFDNNSAKIDAKYNPDLQFMATHLSRINEPKFDISITGHASATGKARHNMKLSEARAKAVEDALKKGGVTNHNLKVNWVGQTGATSDPMWRKVDLTPAITAGFTNEFDTIPHEFGHMIGLGDEYKDKGGAPLASHHDLVTKAFGKKYADLVAVRGSAPHTVGTASSIMNVGKDVRIYHYVTFWSALCETTLKASVPTPPFGYDDWKFIG
jgi:outer membrane protein OmpA-like peptidoglycan-associated protein